MQATAVKPSISALPAFFLIAALNFIVYKSKRYLVISKLGTYGALQYPPYYIHHITWGIIPHSPKSRLG
jgi:hypothetical protein